MAAEHDAVVVPAGDPAPEEQQEQDSQVAVLLDDQTTGELHDDTTLLRDLPAIRDEAGLVLFDALRFWIGGAVQYDYHNFDGIYNHSALGDRDQGFNMRRLEGTLRSRLYDWGELKVQYDLDTQVFRDTYLRWISERPNTPVTVTIGNQKEPIGMDYLIGNKFSMAQERSAPSHAFAGWRSLGLRLHRAFQLDPEERRPDIFEEDTALVTTSVGIFTQDIEESHDTDLAVTGRLTGGRKLELGGMHLGLAASYREGEFNRVSFRPEVQEAERITLARPVADTQAIVAAEAAYNHGRFHFQAEAYYSDYSGEIDGYGGGGYVQAGWFVTSDSRRYNSRWGIMAPHQPVGTFSVEVFARLSHTRGDDDADGWNDYKSLTLGSSVYYRQLRASINLLYGQSRESIDGEDSGLAFNARLQYLL